MIDEENQEQLNEEIIDEVNADTNSVDVEVTEPSETEELVEEIIETQKDFYSNLAEDIGGIAVMSFDAEREKE